ncbi:hypothetical protein [Stenomitos frigidus]|nr:hypothetical protein [Stenomitos frigidus]
MLLLIVTPHQAQVLALATACITPQASTAKQDCEVAAAKRDRA